MHIFAVLRLQAWLRAFVLASSNMYIKRMQFDISGMVFSLNRHELMLEFVSEGAEGKSSSEKILLRTPDIFIARARNGTILTRMKVVFEAGARFWAQRLSEWYYRQFLGRGRRRPPTSWSWFSVMGKPLINDDGESLICIWLIMC